MVKHAISFVRRGGICGDMGRIPGMRDPGHSRSGWPTFVRSLFIVFCWMSVVAASASADEAEPLIKRLDDARRAKVLAALAGLIILGFAMVLLTWLGARITQRFRHSSPAFRPTPRPSEHEWARKPVSEDDS